MVCPSAIFWTIAERCRHFENTRDLLYQALTWWLYFCRDRGSLDLTLLDCAWAGAGRCFPRMELLSISTQSILWSDLMECTPSKGEYPALEIRTAGDAQIASIGVRERFRLWVAGGDAGRCSERIASERPRPVSNTDNGLLRASEF